MKIDNKHYPPVEFYIIKAMREDMVYGLLRLFHVRDVIAIRKLLNDKTTKKN